MTYSFSSFEKITKEIIERLHNEHQGVRTGRASPLLLEGVVVNVLDTRLPLKQLASINIEGARMLQISPWDKSQTKLIESAIASTNLGLSTVADNAGLKVIFPELTAEGREKLGKVVLAQLETARVAVRQARDKVWSDIQAAEKNGKLTEDEKYRAKESLQKLVDKTNQVLEELTAKKIKVITT